MRLRKKEKGRERKEKEWKGKEKKGKERGEGKGGKEKKTHKYYLILYFKNIRKKEHQTG